MRTSALRRAAGVVLAGLLLLLCQGAALGHLVIFKDGYVLRGEVKRQTTNFIDPASGQQVEVNKLGGFFMVDDVARRIVFSLRQVEEVDEKDVNRDADLVRLTQRIHRLDNFRLPAQVQFLGTTPFDAKWERDFNVLGPLGKIKIPQRLTVLSPHYARVDALRYYWTSYYLTRELDPALVRSLLYQHSDLKLANNATDADKRYRVFKFFLQAGWYDPAEYELLELYKAMPDQKEKVETGRELLRKARAAQRVDEIEEAQRAGRYQWVQEQIATLPTDALDEKQQTRFATLRAQAETAQANLATARRLLRELPAGVTDPYQRQLFTTASAAIAAELTPDTASRLEAFVNLAQQAQRDREQGRSQAHTPDQLLALAVTGWLLGNVAAEARPDTAERLWRSREFVLAYQRAHNQADRQQLLAAYQKGGAIALDEMERLIRTLPPPEPYSTWGIGLGQSPMLAGYWLLATQFAAGLWPPLSDLAPGRWPGAGRTPALATLRTELPWSRRRPIDYLVQVPPEYHPGRAYPVLFALAHAGEKPLDLLGRCSALAAHHGYLLVAPTWEQGLRGTYQYTADEHAAVLDVLRDLRRRFQVDSDRVFLFGWGEGGNMAYDVGLSHPDQFAGVVPMAARPRYHARIYWRNAQYLPFYVIDGDLNGDNPRDNRRQFQDWVPRGYPALYVEYKGRGPEWYGAELPYAFDWMSRKKRASAFPELGKHGSGGPFGEEFQSMRATDDRFYWLSAEEINSRNVNEAGQWNPRLVAASMQARIGESNQINAYVKGFRKATVWLGPGMIDFSKPVTLYLNMQQRWINRPVTPSLATLLEDFYLRGDRQRLYWARLDFTL